MTLYRVSYEIDIDASTPEDASREAYERMRDTESQPPILYVIPWEGDEPPPSTSDNPLVLTVDCNELKSEEDEKLINEALKRGYF